MAERYPEMARKGAEALVAYGVEARTARADAAVVLDAIMPDIEEQIAGVQAKIDEAKKALIGGRIDELLAGVLRRLISDGGGYAQLNPRADDPRLHIDGDAPLSDIEWVVLNREMS